MRELSPIDEIRSIQQRTAGHQLVTSLIDALASDPQASTQADIARASQTPLWDVLAGISRRNR
jgi:hypothetical protein